MHCATGDDCLNTRIRRGLCFEGLSDNPIIYYLFDGLSTPMFLFMRDTGIQKTEKLAQRLKGNSAKGLTLNVHALSLSYQRMERTI